MKSMMKKVGIGTGMIMASVGSAYAALPEAVNTQVGETTGNLNEAGALLVGLAVVAMGWRWLKAAFF